MKKIILKNGLLLLGAGKMGGALLKGWLSNGLDPKKIYVFEPNPSHWLKSLTKDGLNLNKKTSEKHDLCVIAVKPQVISELLLNNKFNYSPTTLFVSIVAGIKLQKLSELLDSEAPVVRVMPNTPAALGKGVSCILANEQTNDVQVKLVESLFSAVGRTFRLTDENQMDMVTAISGSGPAYVFYLIEALAAAGVKLGLNHELSSELAGLTVSGAGMLAEQSDLPAHELRVNVTSPNGTTDAALNILMDTKIGLFPLMRRAVLAACKRSKELGL